FAPSTTETTFDPIGPAPTGARSSRLTLRSGVLATVVQFGDAPKLPKSLSSLLRGRGGGAQTSDSEETLTGHPGEPAALGPTGAAVPSELRRPGAEERVAAGFVEPGTSVAG